MNRERYEMSVRQANATVGIAAALVVLALLFGVLELFTTPVVYQTWPDGKVKAVEYMDGGWCKGEKCPLPKKFEITYVDPGWGPPPTQ
jgi:hypothetical protein